MPYLSEIQKKYKGQVNVTGVNIWEDRTAKDNSFHTKVADYVKTMGDKMIYNVAADGFEGKIAKNWMEASEGGGIPTAFIVGKDGTVLWIGHPMGGMEKALDEILAGTYDLETATKKDADRRAGSKAQRELMGPIRAAIAEKDIAKAVTLIDDAIAKNPKLAPSLGFTKFNLLLRSDEAKAMAWAGEFADGPAKDNPNLLNAIAWSIVDDQAKIKNPDYALAVRVAERGVSLLKDGDPFAPYLLDTFAYALYKSGQIDRALEIQTKAVTAAEGIANFDAATMKEIKDRLDMFKAKKKASGGGGG